MDDLALELNLLFVDTFRTILKVEENILKNSGGHNLSISEMHTLEAAGKGNDAKTIGEVAQALGITMPSVTVTLSRLEKKGLLTKTRADGDGRSVLVRLTPFGERVEHMHERFHAKMVNNITEILDEEEKRTLLLAVQKLNVFFKGKLSALED